MVLAMAYGTSEGESWAPGGGEVATPSCRRLWVPERESKGARGMGWPSEGEPWAPGGGEVATPSWRRLWVPERESKGARGMGEIELNLQLIFLLTKFSAFIGQSPNKSQLATEWI
jgi:hypothetical protein